MVKREYSIEVAGKKLTVEFNDLAENANGSVLVRYGQTIILVTAVMSSEAKESVSFFPLTIDYEERFYASGKILGSRYVRREGRPSEEAILSGRIVDRTIRPLFAQYIRHEIQIIITVLSLGKDDPDTLAVIGASLALGVSDIPWQGPVSAIRIAQNKKGELIINPDYEIRENPETEFETICCGKDGHINMIELAGKEVSKKTVMESFKKASQEIEGLQDFQQKIIKEIGKKKRIIEEPETTAGTEDLFIKTISKKMKGTIFCNRPGKSHIHQLREEWLEIFMKKYPEGNIGSAAHIFEEELNRLLHQEAINNDLRADGRKMDEVRPIFAKAGEMSSILHGTGIFYRGGTHILSVLTLGGPGDSLIIDGIEEKGDKRFIHHYNFPPFSSGETGKLGGFNRRMIGHGALAEKALLPLIPPKETFPYTIRVVSEALSSNGSTSMGSVCAASLALMDGGVPIKRPVAGIASGLTLIKEGKNYKYKVLTDIQGPEDEHGDMDFKVAGTKEGITAIQMDVKVSGIPINILDEALDKAQAAISQIIDKMNEAISSPRENISDNAPKILTLNIKIDQIGLVIGPGGKTINGIKDKTGTEIDIEDDGAVFITGQKDSAKKAREIILALTKEYLAGERFEGEVARIMDFGAFVKIGPNQEGLVHISEIASFRVDKVDKYLAIGQKVPVVIKEIDDKKRVNLSIKMADPNFIKQK